MSWKALDTRAFKRKFKRLSPSTKDAVNVEIRKIEQDSSIGTKKKANLRHFYVHKFKHQGQLYLLAYTKDDVIRLIYLESVGSHENFYRDIAN